MKLDALHLSLLLAIAVLVTVFFLTPYEYHLVGNNYLIRVHRITGDAERLTGSGWREMKPAETVAAGKWRLVPAPPGQFVLDEKEH